MKMHVTFPYAQILNGCTTHLISSGMGNNNVTVAHLDLDVKVKGISWILIPNLGQWN